MTQYTFTFDTDEEQQFNRILARLESEEYKVIQGITPTDPENTTTCSRETIMEMDPEASLTFRLGMKHIRIRRERTEEELAEEKINEDRHKITIRVVMPPGSV